MKSSESSNCNVLAAAALTSGILKHGRGIDINHLNIARANAHTEVVRQTAKQHEIRLTGELVSFYAC